MNDIGDINVKTDMIITDIAEITDNSHKIDDVDLIDDMTGYDIFDVGLKAVIFIWSSSELPDRVIMEKWLSDIDSYVKKNKINWRVTDEIFIEK